MVPDGTDLRRDVKPSSADTLGSLGLSTDRPLVVQIAQLVGHKDPVNFVEAMAVVHSAVPVAQALLVGDGPLRAQVEAAIRALGLSDVVRLAGYRTDADALLAAADVACLSSREEGMGSVVLDAFALGIPVAATRAGGIPEVIVDGVTGLLAPVRNARALGDAIVRLLTDASLRERVRAAARARVMDFSVERMTARTLAVYERVVGVGTDRASTRVARASSASSGSVTGAP